MKTKKEKKLSILVLKFLLLFAVSIIGQRMFGLVSTQPLNAWQSVTNVSNPVGQEKKNDLFANNLTDARNCRYGVSLTHGVPESWISTLRVGWYKNFAVRQSGSQFDNVEFVQVVRIGQERDANQNRLPNYYLEHPSSHVALVNAVEANLGSLWLIGNEPDRVFWQDDIFPDVYAKAYHELYHLIKSTDPTAKVAIAGLVQVTPNRLQYLDIVWDSYLQRYGTPIPVDVWNMHTYILPEARINEEGQLVNSRAAIALGTDPNLAILESDGTPNLCSLDSVYCYAEHDSIPIFIEQVRAMRMWMKNKGEQNKPLILSEYSLLYPFADYDDPVNPTQCFLMDEYGKCFTPARVREFMYQTFDYLESAADPTIGYPLDQNRLVQQWLWYSTGGDVHEVHPLVNTELSQLTTIGEAFVNYINGKPLVRNLVVEKVSPIVLFNDVPSETVTATLSVQFRNNGNTTIAEPFVVTFYEDAQRQHPIGSVIVPAGIGGCARDSYSASIEWSVTGSGKYPFWVMVDSTNVIFESFDNDNIGSSFVLVNPRQIFLPTIRR
jgi:hypothetical protein